jgi:hypothetical protein
MVIAAKKKNFKLPSGTEVLLPHGTAAEVTRNQPDGPIT